MRHWCVIGLIILLAGQPLACHAAVSVVTLSKDPNLAALKALLTEPEDAQMLAYYALHPGRNSVGIFDNCAARTNQALNAGGVPTQDIPFPGGLSRDVGSIPGAHTFFIPQGGPIPQGLMNLLPGFEPH